MSELLLLLNCRPTCNDCNSKKSLAMRTTAIACHILWHSYSVVFFITCLLQLVELRQKFVVQYPVIKLISRALHLWPQAVLLLRANFVFKSKRWTKCILQLEFVGRKSTKFPLIILINVEQWKGNPCKICY